MVAVMMPSNFLFHVSLPVNATLPSPLQFSTRKLLKDDALIIIILLRQQVWCIGAFSSREATYGSMIRAGNLTQRRREKRN